ncbi:popeye domain-containing protein 3-like [Lineus longissimus]|uniref:popeye domain-containing protein 3-like n=1 Tax=Lineus longissimus TaxID=88925 RepID=UPI002B4EB01E
MAENSSLPALLPELLANIIVAANGTNETEDVNATALTKHELKIVEICTEGWYPPNHMLFQLGNMGLLAAFMLPTNSKYGALFLHSFLVLGFLFFCTWAWVVLCAPDIFSWNFAFLLINAVHMFSILYRLRPVKFSPELEEIYESIFQPLKFPRHLFKKLTSSEYATLLNLNPGASYAAAEMTKTDRLALLISGNVKVISQNQVLHHIRPKEFFDSPEFESTRTGEEKFQVSIVAVSHCRYIYWKREALHDLYVKEQYLAQIMSTIIGRDIANKLYALNDKLKRRGSRMDIRLPSVTSIMSANELRASFIRHLNSPSLFSQCPESVMTMGVTQEDDSVFEDAIDEKTVFCPNGQTNTMAKEADEEMT